MLQTVLQDILDHLLQPDGVSPGKEFFRKVLQNDPLRFLQITVDNILADIFDTGDFRDKFNLSQV